MLSASLQAEAEQKKQLEEELQQSRDEVRSSPVTFGSTVSKYLILCFHLLSQPH